MAGPLGGNFRRLWAASAASNVADGVFQLALPLVALGITRSPAAVAGVTLAAKLPWLLFALHAGALADRLDRRRTMAAVNLGRVVVIGSLAAGIAGGVVTLPLLYAAVFVLGIGETLFDTAAQSVLPSIVGRDDLSRANGRLYAVELTMNQFVGPPLGGILAGLALALPLSVSAAAFGLAAAAVVSLRGAFRPQRTGPRTRLTSDVVDGVRFLVTHAVLRTLAAMVGVMNLAFTAAFAVFPIFAVRPGPLGLSEAGFGMLLTTSAAGSLAGTALAARLERRFAGADLLAACVVTSALPLLALGLWPDLIVAAVGFFVTGASIVVWNVLTVSLRQRIVPDHLLGRVNAAYRVLAWGTIPIGAAIGGALAEAFGIRAVFVAGGVGGIALAACRLWLTPDRLAAADPGATDSAPLGSL